MALEEIGAIDTGCGNRDPDLAFSEFGCRYFRDAEDILVTGLIEDNCTHGATIASSIGVMHERAGAEAPAYSA